MRIVGAGMPEPEHKPAPGATDDKRAPSIRLTSLAANWLQPSQLRSLLATLRVFAGCNRLQINRVARWGDVIETEPGDVFMREDHTDYWFVVVLAGSLRVTSNGREVTTLRPGEHYGERAIVGFAPQTATVTVLEPTVLFVLGRRYLLSLAAVDKSIQRVLFPTVTPEGYRPFVREMHAQGRVEWARVAARRRHDPDVPVARTRPGRFLSWGEAVQLLSHHDRALLPEGAGTVQAISRPTVPSVTKKWWKLGLVTSAVAAVGAFSLSYHPPVAVVSPGEPIDVSEDISITGAKVYRPNGRYLLTTVRIERPTLAGALFDQLNGRVLLRTSSPDLHRFDPTETRRLAREAFLRSHRSAIELAEKAIDVDHSGVTIAIRDRGVLGPSGGLIYALAIVDMLDAYDLASGRVIAATGELQPDGKVTMVGFIAIKSQAARDRGTELFLVPWEQAPEARHADMTVEGVRSLKDAVRLLKATS